MKIVTFDEFRKLPPGTIFSFWEPCAATDLCIKGETWDTPDGKPCDFLYATLTPTPMPEIQDAVLDLGYQRWGHYHFTQLFAVYGHKDVKELIDLLQSSFVRTEFP